MTTEWLVKYHCYPPLREKPVVVSEVFDDEDCLSEFCWECPEDVIAVFQITHIPLTIEDVTEHYVPAVTPSKFDREEARGERIAEMRRETA